MSKLSADAMPTAKILDRGEVRGGTAVGSATLALAIAGAVSITGAVNVYAEDRIAPYKAAREDYINTFRVTGKHELAPLTPLEHDLRSLADTTSGEVQARALFELGSVQRLSDQFPQSVSTLTRAAELATGLGRSEVAFDAWIGVARAHIIGTHDHGAAEAAMERAIVIAGISPSPKQRFEIARYYAERSVARGEIEAGLVGALDAVRLAPAADDRFYGELDLGDAIEKLANSCDYRPIQDERSADDPPDDPWGACRRAVAAARAAYERAARFADGLGWTWLAGGARQFIKALDLRLSLIERRAHASALPTTNFEPREKSDVLVESGDFARSVLVAGKKDISTENPNLIRETEQVLAEADKAQGGQVDPRNLWLRGFLLEMQGGEPEQAAQFYARAAGLLAVQRSSFFDPSRRGTVIESYGEIFRDLATRLLAVHRDADAFAAFEAIRARGLGEMQQALARKDVPASDTAELAELLRLEAETSAAEALIVERAIGGGVLDVSPERLLQWEKSETARRSYLLSHEDIRVRFAQTQFSPVSLTDLQRAASRNGIPVLLYWVANANVILWYIGPHGSDVRLVFLPEAVLTQKIARLMGTIDKPGETFDARVARELYLYLIAPFEDLLDTDQFIIVPQGPIVGLPFEALIQSPSGDFLVDRWVVSYAPNATIAYEALNRPAPKITRVTAIFDPALDYTEEKGIQSTSGLQMRTFDSTEVLPGKLGETLQGAESAHVLLHGRFDPTEPLRSMLGDNLPATSLLALPLKGMKLTVLSACESGRLGVRISNEIYGFPWVLLAGGVENVVTSLWMVSGVSNGAWMQSFYRSLADGSSPAAAAAFAMRTMHKDRQSNPYFWAAMQVNGR